MTVLHDRLHGNVLHQRLHQTVIHQKLQETILHQTQHRYVLYVSLHVTALHQRLHWTLQVDHKRKSPHHIIVKTPTVQNKEKILRAAREKSQVTYKGKPIRITPDFSMETLQARRTWIDILPTLREHGCHPRLLYPAKLSITINGENKMFNDKTRFKQYVTTNPAIQKVLEGKLQSKEINYTCTNIGNR